VKILHSLEEFKTTGEPVFLAIGCFDGLHIGHRAVIQTAIHHAKNAGGQVWVLTFSPHPAKTFDPDHAPPLISTQEQQLILFQEMGIDGVIIQPFTSNFVRLEPAPFFDQLLATLAPLAGIFVGENWTFGKNRSGTTQTLQRFCDEQNMIFSAHDSVCWKQERISSSRIRAAFKLGHISDLKKMLGREPSTIGTVIHGEQIGRTLGFPTANIEPQNELLPPRGIYAAHLRLGSRIYPAAAYLGKRATFHADAPPQLEVHLINQSNIDLYGKTIEVSYIDYIRDDQTFASPEALKTQINNDLNAIRRVLKI
jgi:riboflavin kinase/FMN adenylyltransferase